VATIHGPLPAVIAASHPCASGFPLARASGGRAVGLTEKGGRKIPKPNKDRCRISVDVGTRGAWLLERLARYMPRPASVNRRPTVSELIRWVIEAYAAYRLPDYVLDHAPPALGPLAGPGEVAPGEVAPGPWHQGEARKGT